MDQLVFLLDSGKSYTIFGDTSRALDKYN